MDGVDILLGAINMLVLAFVGVDTMIGSATSGDSWLGYCTGRAGLRATTFRLIFI